MFWRGIFVFCLHPYVQNISFYWRDFDVLQHKITLSVFNQQAMSVGRLRIASCLQTDILTTIVLFQVKLLQKVYKNQRFSN